MYNTNIVVLAASLIAVILIARAEAAHLQDASLADPDTSDVLRLSKKSMTLLELVGMQSQEQQIQERSNARYNMRTTTSAPPRSIGALCLWKVCP
ncbi:hypothetical protein BsWGS_26109 [Bradybaena similaris]